MSNFMKIHAIQIHWWNNCGIASTEIFCFPYTVSSANSLQMQQAISPLSSSDLIYRLHVGENTNELKKFPNLYASSAWKKQHIFLHRPGNLSSVVGLLMIP